MTTAPGPPSPCWRRCRVYFRRFRLTVWTVLLLLIGAGFWLHQAGLPGFVKRPLLEELRARGIDLQFTRIRLSLAQGIVLDDVSFQPANNAPGPQFNFAQLVVGLDWPALLHRRLRIDNVNLRRGRLAWPLLQTNRPPRTLVVDNVQTDLRLLPDDVWSLDHFRANLGQLRIQLAGNITHASAMRQWFQPSPGGRASNPWPDRFRQFADTLELLQFQSPPDLRFDVDGDARDPWSFSLRLYLNAPDAKTPWGDLAGGRLLARVHPATSNHLARADLSLTAASAQTRWGNLTNFNLHLYLLPVVGQANPPAGELSLGADYAETRWASAARLELKASFKPLPDRPDALAADLRLSARRARCQWAATSNLRGSVQGLYTLTNPLPLSAAAQLTGQAVETPWGRARQATVDGRLAPGRPHRAPEAPQPVPPPTRGAWSAAQWYALLADWDLDWEGLLIGVESHGLEAERVACQGDWRLPLVTITNLQARFDQGQVSLDGKWNVATNSIMASIRSDADPARFAPLLPESARAWLKEAAWPAPPRIHVEASLLLPPATNRSPDWLAQVLPSLRARGEASLPQGATVKGIAVTSAETRFAVSNECWELSDLLLIRPEGRLTGTHAADLRSATFHSHIASTIDPRVILPLLPPTAKPTFELLTLPQPPVLEADVWGNLRHLDELGFRGRARLTNFAFRGEAAEGLQTGFQYTNRYLEFLAPRVQLAGQQLSADGLAADFIHELVFLTNGFGTGDPMVVARAIGPHTGKVLEPFQFLDPPTVHGYGTIPMRGNEGADLFFHVEGRRFHWLYFGVPAIAGVVRWQESSVTLSDVRADFYDGKAWGSAAFFFSRTNPGTDFTFSLTTTNTELKKLMAAVYNRSNHMEGRLSGVLVITNGNAADWRRTGGYGNARLQDGLIWEIPLFGILSKPLDAIAPGLGKSRVTAGDCSFAIANGVIRSDNLTLHSPAVSLSYHGTTDLQGRLNARVEIEPLRTQPLVGPLLGLVFWPVTKLFEYKVNGTLADPKTEILNPIPRLLFLPFHPWRTLRSFFPDDAAAATPTNRPPAAPQPNPSP